MIRIGTAGWSLPAAVRERFSPEGSLLKRYASVFDAVEVNSSFYRPHRPRTYARWAAETPAGFRFAVKAPRAITHEARLAGCGDRLARLRAEAGQLADKLGPLLVQLPPSLAFDAGAAEAFFDGLRALWPEPVACEPRHGSWFTPQANGLLVDFRVARVAADPAPHPLAGEPGGWRGLDYWRLHGSPHMYRSPYGPTRLRALLDRLTADEAWVIFDNTASGAASVDALDLQALASGARITAPRASGSSPTPP